MIGINLFSYNLTPGEQLFITRIKDGLELQGDKLTDLDFEALITPVASVLETLEKHFKEAGMDKQEWNNRMVEALNTAFNYEVDTMNTPEHKELRKTLGIKRPPHESWDSSIRNLVGSSEIVLSGIVQNWYHKYWQVQARKSAAKTISSGCLLPIMLSICLITTFLLIIF